MCVCEFDGEELRCWRTGGRKEMEQGNPLQMIVCLC